MVEQIEEKQLKVYSNFLKKVFLYFSYFDMICLRGISLLGDKV